ncbi:MAG: group 1 truncated hemoglobin [Nitriliruptorales bacterium]|nr:group 1 truncated hemoglobin [Nitriliruptorales bacterium]
MSLYDDLGGDPAIAAALDRFYEKVEADDEINGYFEHVDLDRLKKRQRSFFAMALGGPNEYDGPGLRTGHTRPRRQGLDEADYDRFMGHFEDTLGELGVPDDKIDEVMAIAHTGKDDVLGR